MQWINKTSKEQGDIGEKIALDYLKQQGLSLVTKNYRCRLGEIDLIMKDRQILVFVEVKYRKSVQFGQPSEAVSMTKQQKIIKTAQFYLQQQHLNAYNTDCRFDIVAMAGPIDSCRITWLTNAF